MENIYNELKYRTPDILAYLFEPARAKVYGRPSYICPLCGHGKGGDGLAIMPDQNGRVNYIKCFACNFYGDIVDLYQQSKGIERGQAVEQLAQLTGIDTDSGPRVKGRALETNEIISTDPALSQASASSESSETSGPAVCPKGKNADYLAECANMLQDSEGEAYLKSRGIELPTAQRFGLGYDSNKRAITIPTAGDSYIIRTIDINTEPRYKNVGEAHLFNELELNADNLVPLWIVEGTLDALSLEQIGKPAVSLNSTENSHKLVERLNECGHFARPLILALDNDTAGQKATTKLITELKSQPFKIVEFKDWPKRVKDFNELLTVSKSALILTAEKWQELASTNTEADGYYLKHNFLSDIENQAPPTPCNLENVNELLGGGFRAGLYVLGAISRLGKTTLAQQIAVEIATNGHLVLFFSLEQNRFTLTAKNINRTIHQQGPTELTAVKIMEAKGGEHAEVINRAVDSLTNDVGDRLVTVTNLTDWPSIKEYVSTYSKRYNVKPFVIIDYLQRLNTPNKNRQMELKNIVGDMQQIAVNKGFTVLAISSLNRANYSTPIDFEAFKEAGEIEYTADVVLGLQLTILSECDTFTNEAQIIKRRELIKNEIKKCPRRVELIALKNRFNGPTEPARLMYNSAGDLFTVDNSTPAVDFWSEDSEDDGDSANSTSGFYKRVDLVNHKPPTGNK